MTQVAASRCACGHRTGDHVQGRCRVEGCPCAPAEPQAVTARPRAVRDEVVGTLHVHRVARRRYSKRSPLGALIADAVAPRYYADPSAYVVAGEMMEGTNNHEQVFGLRGAILRTLNPEDHDGRRVRLKGMFRDNPHFKLPRRLASVTRCELIFLEDE